jgi:hypothetical protein
MAARAASSSLSATTQRMAHQFLSAWRTRISSRALDPENTYPTAKPRLAIKVSFAMKTVLRHCNFALLGDELWLSFEIIKHLNSVEKKPNLQSVDPTDYSSPKRRKVVHEAATNEDRCGEWK